MRNRCEESNYRNDHRVRAGQTDAFEGFDEKRMKIRLALPKCDKACCTEPYSVKWHHNVWVYDSEKKEGRFLGINGFEFVRGRVKAQECCLVYFDGETWQGLGPLGFGTAEACYDLENFLNRDWQPASHPDSVEVRAKFVVCPTCEGRGSHVNPSIDASGISGEDFNEDTEFHDAYFAGVYDVPCYGCRGRRVIPTIDDGESEFWTDEQKAAVEWLDELRESDAEMAACYEAERRMGA